MVKSGPSATWAGRCGPHTATFHLRSLRRHFLAFDQLLAQSVGGLLQREAPIIQHEQSSAERTVPAMWLKWVY